MTILNDDLNAKTRSDSIGYESIIGRHGLAQINENGEIFADFLLKKQNGDWRQLFSFEDVRARKRLMLHSIII